MDGRHIPLPQLHLPFPGNDPCLIPGCSGSPGRGQQLHEPPPGRDTGPSPGTHPFFSLGRHPGRKRSEAAPKGHSKSGRKGKRPRSSGRRWAIVCPGIPQVLPGRGKISVSWSLFFPPSSPRGCRAAARAGVAPLVFPPWVFPCFGIWSWDEVVFFLDDWAPPCWAPEGKREESKNLQELGQPDGQERAGSSRKFGQQRSPSQIPRVSLGWDCPQTEGRTSPEVAVM